MSIPIIYTDGGCSRNPGPMGIGVVVTIDDKIVHEIKERPKGEGTNNIAEYLAIIRALEFAKEQKYPEIIIKSDSQLCVGQLSKNWKINQPHLRDLYNKAKELEKDIKVNYKYIPRNENLADRLSNMGL